jgi:hypothetical protein
MESIVYSNVGAGLPDLINFKIKNLSSECSSNIHYLCTWMVWKKYITRNFSKCFSLRQIITGSPTSVLQVKCSQRNVAHKILIEWLLLVAIRFPWSSLLYLILNVSHFILQLNRVSRYEGFKNSKRTNISRNCVHAVSFNILIKTFDSPSQF